MIFTHFNWKTETHNTYIIGRPISYEWMIREYGPDAKGVTITCPCDIPESLYGFYQAALDKNIYSVVSRIFLPDDPEYKTIDQYLSDAPARTKQWIIDNDIPVEKVREHLRQHNIEADFLD